MSSVRSDAAISTDNGVRGVLHHKASGPRGWDEHADRSSDPVDVDGLIYRSEPSRSSYCDLQQWQCCTGVLGWIRPRSRRLPPPRRSGSETIALVRWKR